MKLHGEIPQPSVEYIVLPRPDKDIVLMATALKDFEDFQEICKRPEPPVKIKAKTGERVPNVKDESYLSDLKIHNDKFTAWVIIKSLESTEGMEWETVSLDDPNTWLNWKQELIDSNFSAGEITYIVDKVMEANGMNDAKLKEARAVFLAGDQEQE